MSAESNTDKSQESENTQFAAYGILRDPEVMSWIVGGDAHKIGHVAIHNVELVLQKFDDVPGAAKEVLRLNPVVDETKFQSVGAVEQDDSGIGGTLYELTPSQLDRLGEWELTDKDWYETADVDVEHPDGTKQRAVTHILKGEQPFTERVLDEDEPGMDKNLRGRLIKQIGHFNKNTK